MSYYVSCQHYYYSGIRAVEIAHGGVDYAGCDMLSMKDKAIRASEGEYDNPKEAVESAIKIQEIWQKSNPDNTIWLCYGHNLDMIEAGGEIEETDPESGDDIKELLESNRKDTIEWAQKEFESLEKCARCGDILPKQYFILPEYDCLDEKFCSEFCAEETYNSYAGDLETEEELEEEY